MNEKFLFSVVSMISKSPNRTSGTTIARDVLLANCNTSIHVQDMSGNVRRRWVKG